MSKNDIIRMARKAGIARHGLGWTCWEGQLDTFAALVAAAEREACVQAARTAMLGSEWPLTERVMRAIRARGTRAEPPFIDPRGSLGEPIV